MIKALSPDVVRPELTHDLARKHAHTASERRRKGWRIYTIDGHELVTHSGWVRGFVAQIGYWREHGTGLALLLNAESSAISDLSIHFWPEVMAEAPMIADKPPTQPSGSSATAARAAATAVPD